MFQQLPLKKGLVLKGILQITDHFGSPARDFELVDPYIPEESQHLDQQFLNMEAEIDRIVIVSI